MNRRSLCARTASVVVSSFAFVAVLSWTQSILFADESAAQQKDVTEVSFELDVQPILTATGCNAGACHGKQRGQNGFQLSLLGFDPEFDHAAISKEGRGRRIFPASPRNSLLLRKAAAQIPHGGGKKIEENSEDYNTILRWITEGAKRKRIGETTLARIELNSNNRLLSVGQSSEIKVTAFYADGTSKDVTARSAFQSNDPAIVSVSDQGKITAGKLPGETAIMARFMNVIEVCHVAIPQPKPEKNFDYESLPKNNFIDPLVWQKLQRLNIEPSQQADDATFMKRVFTDIIGRLPTADESRNFLNDKAASKRKLLVDQLLEMPEYADFWANKWADLLRTNPYRVGIKTTLNYDHWIRQQFRDNVPYDKFVRKLVSARGSTFRNGAVTLFRDRRSPDEITTIVTQLFLGIRLECAKCHHHPFEKWSQDDFYSFAAFFKEVGRKGTGLSPPISGSEEFILETGKLQIKHPTTGAVLSPRPLFGEISTKEEPAALELLKNGKSKKSTREILADWLTSKDNTYFAQVQVNRVWADLMGRGIVEPVDDIRATNPPTNAALLSALAKDFQDNDFDLKQLIRTICNSYVYGLSSIPNEKNIADRLNYSRHYRHRLRAETLIDSIDQLTGIESTFAATPSGSRATQIWTHRASSVFLDTFGRPNPNEDPPCERTSEFTVTQSLHLMNANEIHSKISSNSSLIAKLAASKKSDSELVEEIYLAVYSRRPTLDESQFAVELIAGNSNDVPEANAQKVDLADLKKQRRKNIEDLYWAMINTPEFSIQN